MTSLDDAELASRLTLAAYPRSAGYDHRWVIDNMMGPHPLWLAEALSDVLALEPGMRVLDLGCGRALTSVFLAREFGVTVWAADLWISAADNWRRVRDAGVEGSVFPVHCEAHDLPFASGYFDAVVSLDAYHYFGTDDLYIGYISRFLRPGGRLGIVVPAFASEADGDPPEHLAPYWDWAYCSFHSPAWWRRHWAKTGIVEVEHADLLPDGWEHWVLWDEVCAAAGGTAPGLPREAAERATAFVRADEGRTLGFSRVVARVPWA
jgi:SAM-dependent methyltransferase